jgi:hypothetical protein
MNCPRLTGFISVEARDRFLSADALHFVITN